MNREWEIKTEGSLGFLALPKVVLNLIHIIHKD